MYDVFISYNSKNQEIADEVYRRLTDEGLQCFLATEKINEPNWARAIDDALKDSRVFVIIFSASANISNEVLKEVVIATRYSRYIFPFRTDSTRLEGHMEYHLSPFHWISAMIPPIELRYQDLVSRIRDALDGKLVDGNLNRRRIELIGQAPSPRAEFTGRDSEIAKIRDNLENNSNTVFLTGMGGIGKSEVARAYARQYRHQYNTIVMTSYQTNLLQLITNDQAITINGCTRGSVDAGQTETDEAYFVRKMEALRYVVNDSNILLIIDNFDTDEDEHLADILSLNCHKIFTTRTNFEELGYPTIPIDALDAATVLLPLMERLDHKYIKPEDKEAALKIIHILDRHTYAVSLTASQMKAGHISPRKMLELLTTEGLAYQTRSTFVREAGAEKGTALDYIRKIFRFAELSPREQQILCYLACSPVGGIDTDLFMELSGIEDFSELRRLIMLNWIQEDADANICKIHTLVRELARVQLQLTPQKCDVYIQNLYNKSFDSWHHAHEENSLIESTVLALLQEFPEPPLEFLREFDEFVTFAWVMNHFTEAEKLALYLYDLACKEIGEFSEEAGYQAGRVAAVYHNQNDHTNDIVWYKKAKDILLKRNELNCTTVLAVFKVARSDMLSGDLDFAKKGFEQAEAMAEQIVANGSEEIHMYNSTKTEVIEAQVELCFIKTCAGQLLGAQGHYDDAVKLFRDQIKSLIRLDDEADAMYTHICLGIALLAMGDTDAAKKEFMLCLEQNKKLHGENNKETILLKELMGDANMVSGTPVGAVSWYADALSCLEMNFQAGSTEIVELKKKYEAARSGETIPIPYRLIAV